MQDYYIENDNIDIYEFDALDIHTELEAEDIPNAFESRSSFEVIHFLDEAITDKIGMPPSGCGFDISGYESDSGIAHYTLIFKYDPTNESHNKYLIKAAVLYYSQAFFDHCIEIFEKKYLSFLQGCIESIDHL